MVALFVEWCRQYPIISIEDGWPSSDWDGWKVLTGALGDKVQLVGDDVFVTNPEILQGHRRRVGNALLVKLNQIGTVSETLDAIAMARARRLRDRDLAPLGGNRGRRSPIWRWARPPARSRPARPAAAIAKYNQLLRIEEELGRLRPRGTPASVERHMFRRPLMANTLR